MLAFIKKYRLSLAITIIVLTIIFVLLNILGQQAERMLIKINLSSGNDLNYYNDTIKYSCAKGDIQTTISEDKSLKVSIECLGNLDRIYNRVYQLQNKNILFVNFSKNKDKIPVKAQLFDTKTNKFKQVDIKMLEETDFIYGKSKLLPKNKILINRSILFNQENNRFYLIPKKNMKAYFDFVKETRKKYGKVGYIHKFKDSMLLFGDKNRKRSILWIEDRIYLRRSKFIEFDLVGNLLSTSKLYEKYQNEVFLSDYLKKNYRLFSYNFLTGKKKFLSNTSKDFFKAKNTFIYQNKLIQADFNKVSIFDLGTKKGKTYEISSHKAHINEFYSELFPDGYILFYSFYDKFAYLFDLNTKKQLVINNSINPQEINCLFSHDYVCSLSPKSLMIPDCDLHFMPISSSEAIITGGGIYCYNNSKFYDRSNNALEGHSFYDLSIKKIKVEKLNKINN